MKRIALAVIALALLTLSPPPAAADHGHNCIWSGGAWVGQGLCPGMPGYTPHADPPSPTPEPTAAPTTTTQPASAPSTTTAAPVPSSTPTVTRTTPAPAPTRTPGCLRSYGNEWCTTGTAPTASAQAQVGPLVDTDIVTPRPRQNAPMSLI